MTRSLSNVIKAYTVCYDMDETKTIDTHLRKEVEIQQRRNLLATAIVDTGEFVEGLKAVVVEPLIPEDDIDLPIKTQKIMDDAKAEAERIMKEAKLEAQELAKNIMAEAQEKGYQEGLSKGNKEIQKAKFEYENKNKQLQVEYETLTKQLEPKFVKLMTSLIQKITGIMVDDKADIIFYLVEKAMFHMDKCNQYTIRVSKEDYCFLISKRNELLCSLNRDVYLDIIEDPALVKNQCLIETDLRVIDCSLDVQLNNLIKDLKLLGGL